MRAIFEEEDKTEWHFQNIVINYCNNLSYFSENFLDNSVKGIVIWLLYIHECREIKVFHQYLKGSKCCQFALQKYAKNFVDF